ncbi:hypothetical protein CEXT_382661 [Caerostris extrusa]|uniref:Uncharacterized protein n=1 Tax=Caerostris extrusa TaxID=172846 RepID=A0AAV4UF89_CAEEX|nr:hypothetical protein CEXT_382661 [Caerostris extrusa]
MVGSNARDIRLIAKETREVELTKLPPKLIQSMINGDAEAKTNSCGAIMHNKAGFGSQTQTKTHYGMVECRKMVRSNARDIRRIAKETRGLELTKLPPQVNQIND